MVELFTEVFNKAATVGNAVKGFARTGIIPFYRNVFIDAGFVPCVTTDRPSEARHIPENGTEISQLNQVVHNRNPTIDGEDTGSDDNDNSLKMAPGSENNS